MIGSGDFGIGSSVWPGIGKIAEEAAELGVVCAKLVGTSGDEIYWDGRDLRTDLEEEIADVMAACQYTIERNSLNSDFIAERVLMKYRRYNGWHSGVEEKRLIDFFVKTEGALHSG